MKKAKKEILITQKERYLDIAIEEELKKSYLTYAMSVIVSRALPDVRDGLKPSQRRILVAMNDLHLYPNAKYRKCAKIAGDTSGNYHPHGESVIYPTLVRMAQPFRMRYPLIDGQGNFGSVDGDEPAAMRYTEARMTHFSTEMLEDLDKNTVDFVPNYDETRKEPTVLPSKFPNLLVNGCDGIAVGMSTSIPPHNLTEVCNAILKVLEEPDILVEDVCNIILGPDFPTGAIICGHNDVKNAYCKGKGSFILRAKVHSEEGRGGKKKLIFTEIPYEVKKSKILEDIVKLIKNGKITGINDLRDESDRENPVRIVVELKKGENEEVILNRLYKFTGLQTSYSINMIAIVNGQPRLLNIKGLIEEFIKHREVVITRRTQFLLKKAEERIHKLKGLIIAVKNIEEVVNIIKNSKDIKESKEKLKKKFKLTDIQADSILEMKLGRLTSLEYSRLKEEVQKLEVKIKEYNKILSNKEEIKRIIKEETIALRDKYGDSRRTLLGEKVQTIAIEDIIPDKQWLVLVTHRGYIKRMSLENYKSQNRGGSGIIGANVKDEDFVTQFFTASAHEYILLFSDIGKLYWLKVYDIPEASRTSKGRAIVNLLNLYNNENITSIIPVREFDNRWLMMVTMKGVIKKTALKSFSNPNKLGIKAIMLDEGDKLISTTLTNGRKDILLATSLGKAIRFNEKEIRGMGRTARGVRACKLQEGDNIIGMVVVNPKETLISITENGLGKRTKYEDYRTTRRGGLGIINLKVTEKTGKVVSILSAEEKDDLMIVTSKGMVIRVNISKIPIYSRSAKGVRIIRLKNEDKVVSATTIPNEGLEIEVDKKENKEKIEEQKDLKENNTSKEKEKEDKKSENKK